MATKILIYTNGFAPNVGGVETYAMLMARDLTGTGLSATLVTPTPADTMNDTDLPFQVVRGAGFAKLAKLIWRADVLHLAGPCFLPLMLGLAFRKPVVVVHHGYQALCPNGLLLFEPTKALCPGHFLARRYSKCLQCNARTIGWRKSISALLLTFPRRWACRLVAQNVAITSHVQNRMRLPKSRVIFYGIPDPQKDKSSVAERFSPAPIVFAYAGRLVSEKGLGLLVEASSRLKKDGYAFRLKFIGDGPERAQLESIVDAQGLREWVAFTGYLRGQDLERALSDVAALVMPSIWEETAGLSAIEHMMSSRLVIVTDIGGLGEVVADAGLKYPVGNAAALASRMKEVLDEPELVKSMGQKARQRALKLYLDERMITDYLALYQELLGRSGQSSVCEEPCQ
jgi:glycosyltransferase involved in cell wall biosynthesis